MKRSRRLLEKDFLCGSATSVTGRTERLSFTSVQLFDSFCVFTEIRQFLLLFSSYSKLVMDLLSFVIREVMSWFSRAPESRQPHRSPGLQHQQHVFVFSCASMPSFLFHQLCLNSLWMVCVWLAELSNNDWLVQLSKEHHSAPVGGSLLTFVMLRDHLSY